MKYDAKILAKLALIFLGLLFLICIWIGRKGQEREPAEGEKITVEDVEVLLQALDVPAGNLSFLQEDSGKRAESGRKQPEQEQESDEPEEYLTYRQYIQIREMMKGEELGLPVYAERYEEEHAFLKADWYAAYRLMLAHFDTESSVWETTVFLLKVDAGTGEAYTENGGRTPYQYRSHAFEKHVLQQMKVYVKDSELLTITEVLPEEYELKNVWVMESAGGILECFYHEITFQMETELSVERESVADLVFRDGKLADSREKKEKIHGKLLRVTEEEMEIEGCGIYRIAEGVEVYKLYGSLERKTPADLKIGYADTDFVIYKGQICAALISEEEAADRIRVLLKNTAAGSNYHDRVELTVDEEVIEVQEKDLEIGERRIYHCEALTDRIEVNAAGNSKEDNAYRGSIECYRTPDGMVLINELPLEEYLYAVVPSEMPAAYPLEALKSQAVCARTYAYRYILRAGLPEVGAHVDDTTSYQVYHNIGERAASTTAVKETSGMLLTYEGEPAQNYYYSTSCGTGADESVWQPGSEQKASYLRPLRLNWSAYYETADGGDGQEVTEASAGGGQQEMTEEKTEEADPIGNLSSEENFRRFIMSTDERDLEREEPWYRWTYTVEELDEEAMQTRIQERYRSSPASVLTRTEGDYYVSQPVEDLGHIRDLSVTRRGDGGVAEELLIETDTGAYKILSEYNIRSILCDRASEVVKQDGSTVVPGALLPSGFFVLEPGKRGENVIGYTLIGGGYGHGVGMSQNGARALGEGGASFHMILGFFFPGCELERIGHS